MKEHEAAVDARIKKEEEEGIGTALEHKEKRVQYAKARRKLGFLDIETDIDGNIISSSGEGIGGVDDPVMDDLYKNKTRFEKAVQENKERKTVDIVTEV